VTVRVGHGLPAHLVPDFDGIVTLPSGAPTISDIVRAELQALAITLCIYRAVVITDEPNEPAEVQIWLEQVG
jgi:hypothetical protein